MPYSNYEEPSIYSARPPPEPRYLPQLPPIRLPEEYQREQDYHHYHRRSPTALNMSTMSSMSTTSMPEQPTTSSQPGPPSRTASTGKTFQCTGFEGCSMSFSRSEHLARHIRKHTGQSLYLGGAPLSLLTKLCRRETVYLSLRQEVYAFRQSSSTCYYDTCRRT